MKKGNGPDQPRSGGFSDRINSQAMEAIGINAVLMKPVIYADLAHTIRQVLETGNPDELTAK